MNKRLIRNKYILLILTGILITTTSCKKNEDPQPEKSNVETIGAKNIGAGSATLRGAVTKVGTGGIIDHGFVWAETADPDLSATGKKSLGATTETGDISYELTGLDPSKTYHLRAYVTDAQGTVFGVNKSFSTRDKPSITSIIPAEATQGDTLDIGGQNFGTARPNITVKIGSTVATNIVSNGPNTVKVVVPKGITEGAYKITLGIEGVETTSTIDFSYIAGLWTKKKDFTGLAREFAISFSTGSKGYIGLGRTAQNSSKGLNDFWEYDPTSESWSQKANYPGGKRTAPVVFLIQQIPFVGLGIDETNAGKKDFWQYKSSSNTWAQTPTFLGTYTIMGGEIGFSIGGKGFIATSSTKDFWEIDQGIWTQKNNIPFTASRVHFVLSDVAYILANDKKLWKYNANNDSWSEAKAFPGTNSPNFSFSANNKGYAAEAVNFRGFEFKNTDLWEYSSTDDSWKKKVGLARKSSDIFTFSEAFVISNKIYIREGSFRQKTFWEFDPNK